MNIQTAVLNAIANFSTPLPDGSPSVLFSRVVDALAEETVAKRVQQVTSAYTEWLKQDKEIKRVKPDVVSYNADGTVKDEAWTKAGLDAKKKITDRIAKIEKAITNALEKNDWQAMNDLGSGG